MKVLQIVVLSAVALAALSGCGGGNSSGSAGGNGKSKSITIKGSDTMVQLCQNWAEAYKSHDPSMTVQVIGGGSGTGIAALINGGTDVCAASRPMKDKEREQIKTKHKKDATEIAVALDGLAVFLSEQNPVQELSLTQLAAIYESKITDWKEVGGKPGKIICYGRENSSGTYMYFKEHVLANRDFATDVQSLPATGAVINAVLKDPAAIGYGGIGYMKGVKAIAIKDKDDGKAIPPTMATVVSGEYPISRKLFFYTVGEPAGELKTFITWALGEEGQKICEKAGYYPVPKK